MKWLTLILLVIAGCSNTYEVLVRCENCKKNSWIAIPKNVAVDSDYHVCPYCGCPKAKICRGWFGQVITPVDEGGGGTVYGD